MKKIPAWLLWALYAVPAAWMLFQVFGTPAFLHGEMIGQAHFWNDPRGSFFHTLFDPLRNQEYFAGRFRYVEYLAEAAYWKTVGAGLLPKDLHDYLAVAVTLLIAGLLVLVARQRQLSRLSTFLCVTFFLWSVPTFMVQAWHYRKAKYLVSVWLLLFIYRAGKKSARLWDPYLSIIALVGALTDPFFILMAPVVAATHDAFAEKRPRAILSVSAGFLTAAGAVLLLNGVIGPRFSELCRLVGLNVPGKAVEFLNFAHIKYFHFILPDLFGPFVLRHYPAVFNPWTWCALLLLGLWGMLRVNRVRADLDLSLLFAFLACLPVSSFLVFPSPAKGMFAMYYGHPMLVLFVLAWMNLFAVLETLSAPRARALALALLVAVIGCHQVGRTRTFDYWVKDHLGKAEDKFVADRSNLHRLRRALKEEGAEPVTIDLDYSRNHYAGTFPCCYHLVDVGQAHTHLAYYLYPVLFRKEIEAGRLKISAR